MPSDRPCRRMVGIGPPRRLAALQRDGRYPAYGVGDINVPSVPTRSVPLQTSTGHRSRQPVARLDVLRQRGMMEAIGSIASIVAVDRSKGRDRGRSGLSPSTAQARMWPIALLRTEAVSDGKLPSALNTLSRHHFVMHITLACPPCNFTTHVLSAHTKLAQGQNRSPMS